MNDINRYKIKGFSPWGVRVCSFVMMVACMCCISNRHVFAQQDTTAKDRQVFGISIHGKPYGDSIVLRWAPMNPVTWQMSMKKGYEIVRIEYKKSGSPDTTLLNKQPILPQTLEEMKATAAKDDKYMALAAQAMYGKSFTMGNDDDADGFIEKIQKANDMFTMRYYFSLQVADLSKEAATALGFRWVDKNVVKGRVYEYFIVSDTLNNQFAVTSGKTVVMNNVPPVPLFPEGLEAFPADKKIELHWYRRQPAGFTTYYIERSDDGGKTYKRLNEIPFQSVYNAASENSADSTERLAGSVLKNSQVFIDSIPQNYVDYHYRIAGIDAFADISVYSTPLKTHGIDLTPPQPVIIDSAVNVTMNHMRITWIEKNKEDDLEGYYVARGDNAGGPFFPLADKLLDKNIRSFTDTTASALQQNYYVVVSVDTAKNISYSIPRVGILTDSIAPDAPSGLKGIMDSVGYVALHWDKNKEPDLAGYRVYISYNPDAAFGIVSSYLVKDNYYLDSISTKSLDRKVYYKIVAVDRNGNHSRYSNPATIYKPILIPPTAPVARKIYMEGPAVHIDWIGSSGDGVWGYEIYRRKKEDTNWDTIALVPRNGMQQDFTFLDSAIVPNIYYMYTAATVDSTGLRSERSFAVQALYHHIQVLPEPVNVKASYAEKDGAIKVTWDAPKSGKNYFFIVYRAKGDGPMEMLQSLGKEKTTFLDYRPQKGTNYRYVIQLKQQGGNLTSPMSKEVSVKP